jgi:glycine/D-amino acid oxidase-like deaminating enzyme
VNAAGAWAGLVAKFAGVDLPVEPLRRMLVPTEPFDKIANLYEDKASSASRASATLIAAHPRSLEK